MRVELHHVEYVEPIVIDGVLNFEFDETYSTLFLYDVKDAKGVDPIEVIVVDHWSRIRFGGAATPELR